MKKLLKLLAIFILVIGSFSSTNTNANIFSDIIEGSKPKVNVDCAGGDCSLSKGTDLVKNTINDIEKEKPFSEFIQDVIFYVLTFVSLIALIYIIYAGFTVLTSAGDEEKAKKAKGIILSVFIGIILIRLAYPITAFIIKALN